MPGITFFIGNGFDLNMGLETRYDQFCNYYIQQNPKDFLAQSMKKDTELWSDVEIALGKITEQVPNGEEDQFGESKDLLEITLGDYLENEQRKIRISNEQQEQIAKDMKRYLISFYQELPVEHMQNIESVIKRCRGTLKYSFVSFNYTNVLDRCVEITKRQLNSDLGAYSSDNGNQYPQNLGNVIHIHGTIESEMILGVNDIDQIADRRFMENSLYKQCMIKEEANKRFAQNKIQRVKKLIDESCIICIFGMSIGETDKMWWQYIGKWLLASSEHRLVIYIRHNSQRKRVTARERFITENIVLQRFKENSGIKEEWEKAESKIYIVCNGNIFNFSIIQKSIE
mgnify:CR=1 FL=1